jgi:predicted RNA binding protein YcfA (HicA-like mRNA interferase family)
MTRQKKLIARFCRQPADFTWEELVRLLRALGYQEVPTGKTGGSRRRFVHEAAGIISLHKPHPKNVVKQYVMAQVHQQLNEEGLL